MEIQISVRNLVEFLLRSGDIDNRHGQASLSAMQEGGRIHRMIQRRMGSDYHAEVPLSYLVVNDEYTLRIDGRADGIIDPLYSDRLLSNDLEIPSLPFHGDATESGMRRTELMAFTTSLEVTEVVIDEIKGTYKDVRKMKEAEAVHVAQACCYAFFYASSYQLSTIGVRLTYCNMESEEIKYFHFSYSLEELRNWFLGLVEEYHKWASFQVSWISKRTESIKALTFPFDYREGQKNLVTYVYQTIYHRRKLFIEAPTGVGKTISTVFPAVKAMGEGMGQRIFYLTAKTITRTVASDTVNILRNKGLLLKTVTLTAKDKICFQEETKCNPEVCPYAKGHYDRINDAIYDLLTHADSFDREILEEYARKHEVCPFEMSLDMSLYADMIICDYNYLFDPHVYLKRFFAEGVREDYTFLVDEAHNLVDRGRSMYSASLVKENFLELKRAVKDYEPAIAARLERCNKEMLNLKHWSEGEYTLLSEADIAPFTQCLIRLSSAIEEMLEERSDSKVIDVVLDFYFEVAHFLLISEKLDENYRIFTKFRDDNSFELTLYNVNPSKNLKECMLRGRSTILFSATLLPIQYFKKLLGADEEDYEVYAKSVFDPSKRGLFIADDVTSKYTRRNRKEYETIAAHIHSIVSERNGNYLVFFPSHAFLKQVLEVYEEWFLSENVQILVQEEYMDEEAREEFLQSFVPREDMILMGFCVMGGIFSEGIDLKKDHLIGAIIVGTGLPMVCSEREILKKYFDANGDNGFDYAYKYPGLNKVMQAAGRVIRTEEDVGIVALLDERFLENSYLRLFPREWNNYEDVSVNDIGKRVERFWNEWL